MSGHTYIHTYTHTYTHDNYSNPRCAHAHRGLMIRLLTNWLIVSCSTLNCHNFVPDIFIMFQNHNDSCSIPQPFENLLHASQ